MASLASSERGFCGFNVSVVFKQGVYWEEENRETQEWERESAGRWSQKDGTEKMQGTDIFQMQSERFMALRL